jgi:hypothetical protein
VQAVSTNVELRERTNRSNSLHKILDGRKSIWRVCLASCQV